MSKTRIALTLAWLAITRPILYSAMLGVFMVVVVSCWVPERSILPITRGHSTDALFVYGSLFGLGWMLLALLLLIRDVRIVYRLVKNAIYKGTAA